MNFKGAKILITGASGFIGSFIVERALKEGAETWASIRKSSSRKYLQDKRIHFIQLNFENAGLLSAQLEDHLKEYGGWDYIIHAAGATKSVDAAGFDLVNYKGTRWFTMALCGLDMTPRKFIFLSSLSVYGPVREERIGNKLGEYYHPIELSDTPAPDTAYGKSKLAAEKYVLGSGDLGGIVLRPTGVYGPRERDYFLMAKSIAQGIDFAVGYQPQEITFIYVDDLVDAIFLAIEYGQPKKSYFLSDGNVYSSQTFSDLLQKEIGRKHVLHIKAPKWFLYGVCLVSGFIARKMHRTTTLNTDKYHILKQRNWQCSIKEAKTDLHFQPKISLAEGTRRTVAWYKKEKWI